MARKAKGDTVQSTMRLPRALWRHITHIAAFKNLSMQQAVQQAVEDYVRKFVDEQKGGK